MENYKCPVCGNTDIHSIGILNGKYYCRRCISFKGEEVEHKPTYPKKAPIHLEYELSPEQKELSNKLVENYKKGIDSLVFAVCGSGKTEIVLDVINYAIRCGEKVGFAIPRRDVVIELNERLSHIFNQNKIVTVYGGSTENTNGDLIILTTHQLYRYYKFFDLLIVDEIDAFPFAGNNILKAFFLRSLRGHYILMSATPSRAIIDYFKRDGHEMVELFTRFHSYPLPVPNVLMGNNIKLFIILIKQIKQYKRESKPIMIFVPTIEMADSLLLKISLFYSNGVCLHSKKENRKQIIDDFRNNRYHYVVTTAVLERGVTFKNAQVIVYHADHKIYNEHTLVQIAGRVGRKVDAPEGEVIFLANKVNKEIENAVNTIENANKKLQNLL